LLEARQYGGNDMAVQELQTRLPSVFNFWPGADPGRAQRAAGEAREHAEGHNDGAAVHAQRYGRGRVLERMAAMQSDSNPMDLHGHDFYGAAVPAQRFMGIGYNISSNGNKG
jgi:laccase